MSLTSTRVLRDPSGTRPTRLDGRMPPPVMKLIPSREDGKSSKNLRKLRNSENLSRTLMRPLRKTSTFLMFQRSGRRVWRASSTSKSTIKKTLLTSGKMLRTSGMTLKTQRLSETSETPSRSGVNLMRFMPLRSLTRNSSRPREDRKWLKLGEVSSRSLTKSRRKPSPTIPSSTSTTSTSTNSQTKLSISEINTSPLRNPSGVRSTRKPTRKLSATTKPTLSREEPRNSSTPRKAKHLRRSLRTSDIPLRRMLRSPMSQRGGRKTCSSSEQNRTINEPYH